MAKSLFSISTLVAATLLCGVSAQAAGEAAVERQALMKLNGAATGVLARMVKGQSDFDAVQAQQALNVLNSAALGFGYMFPEGSETGANTEAAATIWSDRAGFDEAVAKYISDTTATITDMDSLKAAFGAAASNCGSCHKAYRVK
ncbi:MAG: cytochrome c [Rhizobiaceae bacterium]